MEVLVSFKKLDVVETNSLKEIPLLGLVIHGISLLCKKQEDEKKIILST